MIELIITLLLSILLGSLVLLFKFRKKGKPKIGIKRNNFSEYFKDYIEINLYYGSLGLIIIGSICLITLGILELFF